MTRIYYVYLIHESPINAIPHCKIGFTHDPVRRLAQLQAGNPRALRSWDFEQRPTKPFGLRLPSKALAFEFEQRLLAKVREMGVGLMKDYNYETNRAAPSEWIQGMHPNEVWLLSVQEYDEFLREKSISYENIKILGWA
ncbi:MAG: GIY-YIG nuclease family protein [Candidatus Contendobacter sp.]|nr:GIY-YIG nuclease family protein [Candidatus Contendobacter sp.]